MPDLTDEIPTIDDFKLDAYGHLSYVVGYDDSDDEEADSPLVVLAKADEMSDEDFDELEEQQGLRDCGDWIACADFDRIGNYVGYHVVVNSDSGGFIETTESGVYTLEEARLQLPGLLDYLDDLASEQLVESGHWYTKQETEENRQAIERWKAELKSQLEDE